VNPGATTEKALADFASNAKGIRVICLGRSMPSTPPAPATSFTALYAFAIGGGLNVPDAMSFASAAAALKCTRASGRAGIRRFDVTNENDWKEPRVGAACGRR
jgi:hypothetical protein